MIPRALEERGNVINMININISIILFFKNIFLKIKLSYLKTQILMLLFSESLKLANSVGIRKYVGFR